MDSAPNQNSKSNGSQPEEVTVEVSHAPEPVVVSMPVEPKEVKQAKPVVNTVRKVVSEPETPWKFSVGDTDTSMDDSSPTTPSQQVAPLEPVAWSASEFIHHQKSFGWYTLLMIAGLAIAAGVYLLTHDKISTGVIIIAILALAVYANHKPRVLNYKLDDKGVSVGDKFYKYDQFKSFSIATEGAFASAVLTPLKRFMPPLSIYFAPEDRDSVVNVLTESLPMEEHKLDAVDSLIGRIRF